jgi:hypothetical protein
MQARDQVKKNHRHGVQRKKNKNGQKSVKKNIDQDLEPA